MPTAMRRAARPVGGTLSPAALAGQRAVERATMKDRLLTLWLLVISGNQWFLKGIPGICSREVLLVVSAGVLLSLLHRRGNLGPSRVELLPFLVFGALISLQGVLLQSINLTTTLGFFCRLFIGYATLKLVRRFSAVYCEVIVAVAVLALVFWVLQISGVLNWTEGLIRSLPGNKPSGTRGSVILHTFVYSDLERGGFSGGNAGMFWEPGAFGGYLLLGLLFLALARDSFPVRLRERYRFILLAASISTMSTTAYLILPLVYVFHAFVKTRRIAIAKLFGALFVSGCFAYFAWHQLDFVGQKTMTQYETAMGTIGRTWHLNRIGNALLDWEYIRRRPLTGWGLHSETRWALHYNVEEMGLSGLGNGLTDFTAKFGFIGMGTFAGMAWLGFFRLSGRSKIVATSIAGIIVIMLNGECFLGHPLFFGLMFLAGGVVRQPCAASSGVPSGLVLQNEQDDGQLTSCVAAPSDAIVICSSIDGSSRG